MGDSKTKSKDMYWFAHGGEPLPDKSQQLRNDGDEEMGSPEQHNSPSWKPLQERKVLPEEARSALIGKECVAAALDCTDNSLLLSSVERDDRVGDPFNNNARTIGGIMRTMKSTEDEKVKKSSEIEQDKNDDKATKKNEREAALEARRNAQRSNVSFAFGSSLPRNLDLDVTTVYQGSDLDRHKRRSSQAPVTSQRSGPVVMLKTKTDDKMSQSMISPMSACRGRRKTDLTPTIPYDRMAPPRTPAPPASSGKRSVSMTRLDQLARPRRSYVEAQRDNVKANSTSSNSSVQKEVQNSPSRPRSSASEHSGGSNRPSTTPPVNMRARTATRKPRPVSIAGTMPDRKPNMECRKDLVMHRTPEKKKELSPTKRVSTISKTKSPALKNICVEKPSQKTPIKHLTPKASPVRKPKTLKSASPAAANASVEPVSLMVEETAKVSASPHESFGAEEGSTLSIPEFSSKRIISEVEAKAALAEKRRLAREQAEREAELERQRQEEYTRQEEERIRKEEEEQRKMEEEQLRLLEEHRRHEEEKLRKAIEEQERKEQEEKFKREEEARLKAEQERKTKEEAERQRIELEEKLRKEEEERAERKKRLEKIMSRTRGRGVASSHSGGDQSDSADSLAGEAAEILSGNSSLNSVQSTDPSSGSASLEIHPAQSIEGSENESLNSMDMIALSENSSLDSNLLMLPSEGTVSIDSDQTSTLSSQNLPCDEKEVDDRNVGLDQVTSKGSSGEPDVVFSVGGCNPSFSSENETVSTVIPSEESSAHCHSYESEENLDPVCSKLLGFGTDFVQTLVSENEDDVHTDSINLPVSDKLAIEKSGVDSTSDDIFEKLAFVNPSYFADVKKHHNNGENEFSSFVSGSQKIGLSETEGFVKEGSCVENALPSPAPVEKVFCHKLGEIQCTHESIGHAEDCKEFEVLNVQSSEIKTSLSSVTLESLDLNEKFSFPSVEGVKTSIIEPSRSDEDHLLLSMPLSEEGLNIPVQDDVNVSNKVFVHSFENCNESSEVCQPFDVSCRMYNENSESVTNTTLPHSFNPKCEVFDQNSEHCVESVNKTCSVNSVSPCAENEYVTSGHHSLFPIGGDSDLTKVGGDCTGIGTTVKEFESSAIHSIAEANLSHESFVATSITDSEDSSLDSNLSQVMNVNIIQSATCVGSDALNGSSLDTAGELPGKTPGFSASGVVFQKLPPYSNENTTANGHPSFMVESFTCTNGIDSDCKLSNITEGHRPVSSVISNEINSNVVSSINNHNVQNILNIGDINFNKVPSNPFLSTDDANVVSENLFHNQEEIMQNPFQTESHA